MTRTSEADADQVAAEGGKATRERILDVALELFTEKGFDGTSLREIADRLEFTKAALYYHFRSKEDILLALHLRIHDVGRQGLDRLMAGPVTLAAWGELMEELLGQMFAQRLLFLMHQRNQAALERMHGELHEAEHDDVQAKLAQLLTDQSIPARDRVRMASSFGAVFSVLVMAGESFSEIGTETLEAMVRDTVRDILSPRD